MSFSAVLALGWLGLAPAPPELAPPPASPPTALAVPAQVPANEAVPASPQATPDQPATTAVAPVFTFTLLGKGENIAPCTHGDAKGDAKVEVEAGENQVKAVLGADAGANVFLGAESTATETVQLTQEFEITSSDPGITQVYLTLESHLGGFIRSKHKASAGMSLASVTIAPVGWATTPLSLSYPAACTGATTGVHGSPRGLKFDTTPEPVKSPLMPLGRYVLQANFVVTASASGLLDAHSTAIFMAESEELDPWEREHDPFKGDSHDDFGFTVTLKADAPPGYPAVSHRTPPKRVVARTKARRVH